MSYVALAVKSNLYDARFKIILEIVFISINYNRFNFQSADFFHATAFNKIVIKQSLIRF